MMSIVDEFCSHLLSHLVERSYYYSLDQGAPLNGLVRMSLHICSRVNYVADNYIYCTHIKIKKLSRIGNRNLLYLAKKNYFFCCIVENYLMKSL